MRRKDEIPLNISEWDDSLAASLISGCWEVMGGAPTVTKMKACYNLTEGVLRLFCVQGEKKDVLDLIEEFKNELIKEVESLYREKGEI